MTETEAAQLQKRVLLLEGELLRLQLENSVLRQKLDKLAGRMFGRKSEELSQQQLQLLLQELTASGPATGKESGPEGSESPLSGPEKPQARKAPKPRGPRVPDHLPVVEEVIIPDEVKACMEDWRCIGEEVTELLDFSPGYFFKRRIVRRKYVRRSDADAAPVIATLAPSLQERSIAAPGLVAQILVGKICDHLPLYRQEAIFESRYGVYLPRQTMTRWVQLAADWLKPIYEQIRTGVMGGGYVQIDETIIKYLQPGHGKARQGYFWVCSRPAGDAVFHWYPGRSAACLEEIVPMDFTGTIQCDGYICYETFAKARGPGIELAACMAHTRRYFFEAKEQAPRLVGWILRQMGHLYTIEARLREEKAGPNLRQAVRASESRPIMERLHRLFIRLRKTRRYTPEHLITKALNYALGQWDSLCVFLRNGHVEIDNNKVENAIRPAAIGRKNWLFFGDVDAGRCGAILYTIVASCRRRGIDPLAYLRDVLTRLPSATNWQIKDLTPEAWAKAAAKPKASLAEAA